MKKQLVPVDDTRKTVLFNKLNMIFIAIYRNIHCATAAAAMMMVTARTEEQCIIKGVVS